MLKFAAIAFAALLATPTLAGQAPAPQRLVISTAGLDLATVEGRRQLELRVAEGAARICGDVFFNTRDETAAITACRAEAMAAARPRLAALSAGGRQLAAN